MVLNEQQAWSCGHPRVPENTSPGGRSGQCRECKTARQRFRYANEPGYRERQRERTQEWYWGLDGVDFNRRLLQVRRAKALARRRQRMEVK
jgi:hypothetical protein